MITRRFISAFAPVHKYITTTIITTAGGKDFKTTGKIINEAGWMNIYNYQKNQESPIPLSGVITPNDNVHCRSGVVNKCKTKAPSRFTEGTLVDSMENAGKYTKEPQLKEILKNCKGIGRPATRDGIVEALKSEKRGYIKLSGKSIVVTEKGLKLYHNINRERIADPSFTAFLEYQLDEIEKGNLSKE